MRVGLVCPFSLDVPGGVQAHVMELAAELMRRGHEVRVLAPASQTLALPPWVTSSGDSVPIPYNGSVARLSFGPRTFTKIREFIIAGHFDVLHIHEPNSPSFSLAALQVAEGPIVATYHASATGSKLLKLVLPLLRPRLEKIRGGIAVSEMARRWQVEQLGGDPVLIPNGVDTQAFARGVVPPVPGRPPELVFLGRLDEPRKGLDILLAALSGLDRGVTVTVMGGGSPRNVPGVNFVGRVSDDEKIAILDRADIYIAPNTGGESFGIVLVEAMAARCAVVASDLEAFAAVCDVESDNPAGLLFRTGDVDDLRAKLRQLIDDPGQRAKLIEAGSRRATLYDWDHVAAEVVRVYETVADGTTVTVD